MNPERDKNNNRNNFQQRVKNVEMPVADVRFQMFKDGTFDLRVTGNVTSIQDLVAEIIVQLGDIQEKVDEKMGKK